MLTAAFMRRLRFQFILEAVLATHSLGTPLRYPLSLVSPFYCQSMFEGKLVLLEKTWNFEKRRKMTRPSSQRASQNQLDVERFAQEPRIARA